LQNARLSFGGSSGGFSSIGRLFDWIVDPLHFSDLVLREPGLPSSYARIGMTAKTPANVTQNIAGSLVQRRFFVVC
jgi:hypothetical protein